jgi:hypothetical protein
MPSALRNPQRALPCSPHRQSRRQTHCRHPPTHPLMIPSHLGLRQWPSFTDLGGSRAHAQPVGQPTRHTPREASWSAVLRHRFSFRRGAQPTRHQADLLRHVGSAAQAHFAKCAAGAEAHWCRRPRCHRRHRLLRIQRRLSPRFRSIPVFQEPTDSDGGATRAIPAISAALNTGERGESCHCVLPRTTCMLSPFL